MIFLAHVWVWLCALVVLNVVRGRDLPPGSSVGYLVGSFVLGLATYCLQRVLFPV